MLKYFLTMIVLIGMPLFANAQVSLDDLHKIEALTAAEKYEEALKQYVWFYLESKKTPGLAGVRNSFALHDWMALANKYPPAAAALINVRDENKRTLLAGHGDFANFQDYASINQVLNRDDETITFFKILQSKNIDNLSSYFIVIEDKVIANKDYALLAQWLEDPIFKYENIRFLRENDSSLIRKNPTKNSDHEQQIADARYEQKTYALLEALIAMGKLPEASEIKKRSSVYFNSKKIDGLKIKNP